MLIRLTKIAIGAVAGVFAITIGFNNVFDYGTNFDVVRHIVSMDMVPRSSLSSRSIHSEIIFHFLYLLIIATQFLGGAIVLFGCWRLCIVLKAADEVFNQSKELVILGVAILFLLYLFGFMIIGGEWFQMWRAGAYNMQEPSFRFIVIFGVVMLFLNQADLGSGK